LGGVYLGTGPGVAAAIATVNSIIPPAIFVILVFLALGLTLAVYTPMIPYMLFTFGAINWFIATVETMIAAPLVAIGLLHPEGHEIWGKAEQALMLMLNIFLRPSLMIFGMIGGMLMTYTVVMMINYAFLNVVSMVSGNSANIVEMIFFMVLYTSIFTTSMNKCFDLIHLVPDKVLRWISGGQEQFGEAGGLDKVGHAMEAGGQKAGEFAKDAGVVAGKGARKTRQAHGKKQEEAAARRGAGGGGGGNAPA
jgi:conjugal transfer/type IV secretion protein DotA/TraY